MSIYLNVGTFPLYAIAGAMLFVPARLLHLMVHDYQARYPMVKLRELQVAAAKRAAARR